MTTPPAANDADYVYNRSFNDLKDITLVVMGWQVHLDHCGGLPNLHENVDIQAAFQKFIKGKAAIVWHESPISDKKEKCANGIAKGKKNNREPWAWSSMLWCSGIPYIWNTLYMHRALEEMRGRGMKIAPEDIERLSPLGYDHINFLGRYTFSLPDEIRQGAFHPLRELKETESREEASGHPLEETIA